MRIAFCRNKQILIINDIIKYLRYGNCQHNSWRSRRCRWTTHLARTCCGWCVSSQVRSLTTLSLWTRESRGTAFSLWHFCQRPISFLLHAANTCRTSVVRTHDVSYWCCTAIHKQYMIILKCLENIIVLINI